MTVDELIKKLTALPGDMKVVVVDNEGNVQDVAAFTRASWIGAYDEATGTQIEDEFIQDEVEGELAAIVVW